MSYSGKYRKGYRAERHKDKKAEAEDRQEYRKRLSAKEQIAVLDARLGKGKGAKRERERLSESE